MPLDEPKLGGPRLYEGNDKEYTMQGLKRILISIILGLSPLLGDMTAAENEPTTGGIEQGTTSVAQQASLDSKPVVRTSFEYVKIPDPEQEDGRTLAKKAFEAFINDNRNAGMLVPFLVHFDTTSLSLLKKTIFRPDSNFWKEMEKIGATREALEEARKKLWAEHEKRYKEAFERLEALHESLAALPPDANVQGEMATIQKKLKALRLQQIKDFRLTLKAVEDELDNNFLGLDSSKYQTLMGWISDKLDDLSKMNGTVDGMNFKNIVIIEENGRKVERDVFQELKARRDYIIRFAEAAGKSSSKKYGLAYVLSWVFTEKNIDVAIDELSNDTTPGEGEDTDDDQTTPPGDDDSSEDTDQDPPADGGWTKANTEIYNTFARALTEKVSFTIGGTEKKGPLASGYIRMEKFYKEDVAPTENDVLGTFRTTLKEKILVDPEFKNFGGEKFNEVTRLGEKYETLVSTIERYKSLKASTGQDLLALLKKYSPETSLENLNEKAAFQVVMEKMALGGASKSDVTRFASLLKNYTQYNLHLAFTVNDAAQIFIKVYGIYKEFKKVNVARRNGLVKWIQEFDSKRKGQTEQSTLASRAEAQEYCQSILEKYELDSDLDKLKDPRVLRAAVNKMEADGITEAEIAKFARSFKTLSGMETQGASSELPSYGKVLKYLVGYVQEKNAEKLPLLNTPFNAMSPGKCLSLMPNETEANLKVTRETEPDSLVTDVTEELSSLAQRRLLCYAAYEWALKERAKENDGKDFIFAVTNEPDKEFDITLGTIFRFMGEDKKSVMEPQATDYSIYEGFSELMDLINNLQDLIIAHLKREFSRRGVQLESIGDGMRVQSKDFSSVTFRIPSKILYDQGKDVLKEEGKVILEKVVPILLTVLGENKMVIKDLSIEGHANSDPYPGYVSSHTNRSGNDGLSDDRALSVFNYWNSEHASGAVPSFARFQDDSGIVVNRVGKGTSELVMNSDGTEDKALSRRTVFKFRLDSEKIASLKNQPEKLRALKKRLQDAESAPPEEDSSDSDQVPVPPVGDPPGEDDEDSDEAVPPESDASQNDEEEAVPAPIEDSVSPPPAEDGDGVEDSEQAQPPAQDNNEDSAEEETVEEGAESSEPDSSDTDETETQQPDGEQESEKPADEVLSSLHGESFAKGTKIFTRKKYGGHMGRYWEGVKINEPTSARLKKIYAHLQAHGDAKDTMVQNTLSDISALFQDVDVSKDTLLDGKELKSFRCRKTGDDCEIYQKIDSIESNVRRLSDLPSKRNADIKVQHEALFAPGARHYQTKKYGGHAGRYHEGVSLTSKTADHLRVMYSNLQQLPEKDSVVKSLIGNISMLFREVDPDEDLNLSGKELRSFRCRKKNREDWEECEIYQQMKAIHDRSLRI